MLRKNPVTSPIDRVNNAIQVPIYTALFMKIAEPRVIRILLFAVYGLTLWGGLVILGSTPEQYVRVIGATLAYVFGSFIVIGSLMSGIAVLPGIWWLERVGIILLATSAAIYAVLLIYLNSSFVPVAFTLALAVSFGMRWVEIRGAQLAPRED
jgi:hypothetical protein